MTVALIKTKAEQALAEQFDRVAAKLPGGSAVAQARRAAMGAFAAKGLPHRRIEEWKYTDLRSAVRDVPAVAVHDTTAVTDGALDAALGGFAGLDADRVVFVNGAYRADLSRVMAGGGLDVRPLGQTLASAPDKIGERLAGLGSPADALVALNTAYMTDGAVVRVVEGAALPRPVLLVFARAGGTPHLVTTRNVVSIGARAQATLIEAFVALDGSSEGQCNALTDLVVGDGASVTHIKAAVAENETHLVTWNVEIGAGAGYRGFQLTAGPSLARNQITVTFKGEDSKLDFSGAFLARGQEHIDTTLLVDHAVPGCESRELFKGVLDDRARGIFQGKIIVRPDAQKTDGKQMAQALMLSEDAEFDSKPELEIYADDVVCGHGSTCAEIDPELVFYCMSRGIPKAEARVLLTESFVAEAMERVEHEAVREVLMDLAQTWLRKRTG